MTHENTMMFTIWRQLPSGDIHAVGYAKTSYIARMRVNALTASPNVPGSIYWFAHRL